MSESLDAKLDVIDLNRVRVASPCSVRWDDMKGDDRKRHCRQCGLVVYDTSFLTGGEIRELLKLDARGERRCMRWRRRADGTLITADCPVGMRWYRAKVVGIAAAALALLSAGFRPRAPTAPAQVKPAVNYDDSAAGPSFDNSTSEHCVAGLER